MPGQGYSSVSVDGTQAYTDVANWTRNIDWDAGGKVVISDSVALLQEADAGTEWFCFHTGSMEDLVPKETDTGIAVTWDTATITFSADSAIRIEPVRWPDRSGVGEHVCLLVKTNDSVRTL